MSENFFKKDTQFSDGLDVFVSYWSFHSEKLDEAEHNKLLLHYLIEDVKELCAAYRAMVQKELDEYFEEESA